MAESESRQENIRAEGDVAGRDINKTTFVSPPAPSRLHDLISKAEDELRKNTAYQKVFRDLQRYIDSIDDDEVSGLENKLIAANRSDELKKAAILKEQFTKMLFEHMLSPSAQKVYAHLLARIETLFDQKIRPLIRAGANAIAVDAAIADAVICPVCNEIDAANALGIHDCDIRGMLYYLTGTCHISWVA
ncbi:hypothetical protein HED60_12610 [Planctomycetales bacterium ZRK34]|nr:hypothetical protein HED60_12610 [Planctomycetales bacterium ZRK34]